MGRFWGGYSFKDDYTFIISIGTCWLARKISSFETKEARKQKMLDVIKIKGSLLKESFPKEKIKSSGITHLVKYLKSVNWESEENKVLFIIDLLFCNPFSPYEIKFSEEHHHKALMDLGDYLGIKTKRIEQIIKTKCEAVNAHNRWSWGKIALYGLGGMLLIGTCAWFAAPAIGTLLGSAAGLTGAAATSYGLALLGGGSLAAGGAGMAGGMWLLTGAGAAIGLSAAGGGSLLLQIGAASARVELMKMQVSFKEILLTTQTQLKKAQKVIRNLERQKKELEDSLEIERKLNDKNAQRVKELEDKVTAIEVTLEWMYEQKKVA